MSEPLGYLLTWSCYGTWLHGDARGSVDDEHNVPGTPFVEPNSAWTRQARSRLHDPPVTLNEAARKVVSGTIVSHSRRRGWTLHGVNVRTNHVHVVIGFSGVAPECVMSQLKAWTTRRLREAGLVSPTTRVWTQHGSTRYLWNERSVYAAIEYTLERQSGDLRT